MHLADVSNINLDFFNDQIGKISRLYSDRLGCGPDGIGKRSEASRRESG